MCIRCVSSLITAPASSCPETFVSCPHHECTVVARQVSSCISVSVVASLL